MPKLNKVNAVLTSKKQTVEKTVTELYKLLQKPQLFTGRTRVYRPFGEDADKPERQHPPEVQRVQHRVADVLGQMAKEWAGLWDLTATQDQGNMAAKADVVVDGAVVLKDVPATSLLYLNRQVTHLVTVIEALPTPDAGEKWVRDDATGLFHGAETRTHRTEKVPTPIVKYDATKEHPAQTELFTKDVPVGEWVQTMFSGAVTEDAKRAWLTKARKLLVAVKEAREQANMTDTEKRGDGSAVLKFVFGEKILDD